MMKKEPSKPAKKLAVSLLVPAFVLFLWVFAQPEYAFSITIQSRSSFSEQDSIAITVDDNSKGELTVLKVLKIAQDSLETGIPFETQIKSKTVAGDSVFYDIRIIKKEYPSNDIRKVLPENKEN